jgi:hypothetical protein
VVFTNQYKYFGLHVSIRPKPSVLKIMQTQAYVWWLIYN